MNISFWKEKGSKYVVFILLGLLILVLCIPTSSSEHRLENETRNISNEEVELRLAKVLSAMEGVGNVEIMITVEPTSDSVFSSSTTKEKVSGVVVVAEGAGNATVNARISEAVKALFSIDVHKISIVKMRSQEERK